jgi:uncharacterized protein (DUF2141 family)
MHRLKIHRAIRVAFSGLLLVCSQVGGASAANAQKSPRTVTVIVSGVIAPNGPILVALYSEATWDGAPLAIASAPSSSGSVTIRVNAPSDGRYGIKLFQDVDSDGHLDTNLAGVPTEPYGFSNNAASQFSAPTFDAASFSVGNEGATQTIALH